MEYLLFEKIFFGLPVLGLAFIYFWQRILLRSRRSFTWSAAMTAIISVQINAVLALFYFLFIIHYSARQPSGNTLFGHIESLYARYGFMILLGAAFASVAMLSVRWSLLVGKQNSKA